MLAAARQPIIAGQPIMKCSVRISLWLLILLLLEAPLSLSFSVCTVQTKGRLLATPKSSSSLSALDQQLLTDLAIAGTLGVFTDPVVERIFNITHIRHSGLDEVEFQDTILFGAADSVSTAARVFGVLILVDLVVTQFGFQLPFEADLRQVAPIVAACLWASLTLSAVKKTIFLQGIAGTKLGRVALYDKLIDFFIAIVSVTVVLDVLDLDVGMGLQSVIAGSGVGALVFSLASKDLAQALIGGFIVQAWDAFEVGDDIRLGDGTEGSVKKIGLVETEITGYDNIAIKIPNSQLTNTRVSNLSRIQRSRVFQTLRFGYSDLPKLPKLLDDIKTEIRASCPKLITDGSKPFQVILTAYEADHIQATVNCHFDIPPSTGEFAENRQVVLLAISRALERNGVGFALPSIVYRSKEDMFDRNENRVKE